MFSWTKLDSSFTENISFRILGRSDWNILHDIRRPQFPSGDSAVVSFDRLLFVIRNLQSLAFPKRALSHTPPSGDIHAVSQLVSRCTPLQLDQIAIVFFLPAYAFNQHYPLAIANHAALSEDLFSLSLSLCIISRASRWTCLVVCQLNAHISSTADKFRVFNVNNNNNVYHNIDLSW